MIVRLWVRAASVAVLLGLLLWVASDMFTAHADGHLDGGEAAYEARYGTAVCATLDGFDPATPWHVVGILQGVMEDGWAADSAVDIVNASVQDYCPEYWPLLIVTGRMFRGR